MLRRPSFIISSLNRIMLHFFCWSVKATGRVAFGKGGLYESGCNGRGRRIEAATIDDSTSQAYGTDCWETSDGAYSEFVEASWYYRGRCYSSVSGEQYRRLLWKRFSVWYAHHLFA